MPDGLFRRVTRAIGALGNERIRQTYQTTFWYPFDGATNVVEEAADALRPHLPAGKTAGVEWWLSRMRTSDVRVDFHRDRDERWASATGKNRHPHLSSVLFLNRVRGGLLAVTDAPPCEDNPSLAPNHTDFDLVAPQPNRFVWFDGRLTHGVLDANNQIPDRPLTRGGAWRKTIVFNWWTRAPFEVPRFSETNFYRALSPRARAGPVPK